MSCGETDDLNTLVDKLANLMTNTIRSCIRNYKSLLPYLGRKVTNSEIRHKLVRVNILLNKLNEELLDLRVEYVTVSSSEQKMDTVLSEGGRKRTASNLLILDKYESKNMKMKAQFSSNIMCSVVLNSEAGISKESENLILKNTEEKINSQTQFMDTHNVKNIKKEIEDSNEAENVHGFSINNSQIPLDHKSCITTNNEKTVQFASDVINASIADSPVESSACNKSAAPITWRENNYMCVPFQSVKSHTSNQEKCEVSVKNIKKEVDDSNEAEEIQEFQINNNNNIPIAQKSCDTTNNEMTVHLAGDQVSGSQRENNKMCGVLQSMKSDTSNKVKCGGSGNVLSRDKDICKGLKGENSCPNSFSYQAKAPLNIKDLSVTFSASEKESAVLVRERANSSNKGDRRSLQSPIKYKKDDVPAQSETEDLLYGIIKIKNGLFRCTLCNRKLYCEMTVSCHIRGKQHQKARMGLTVKKNRTKEPVDLPYGIIKAKNGMYRCTLCSRRLVCDTAMQGHIRGNQHKTALITVKNNYCAKESQVPNNRYRIEFVSYPAVQEQVKEQRHKIKKDDAKNSCSEEVEVSTNNSKSTAQISISSAVACRPADTAPSNRCDTTVSASLCSAVPCSLADNVAIVEAAHQVLSMKPAVLLNDIWTHFYAPFHINKKFFGFNSGQIICFLCYEQVGRYIMNVRAHISGSNHLDRISTLRDIELKYKTSNKQLLDIPGSLNNVVPASQFSWCNNGFFCNVCNCLLENTVVLSHMTGKDHGKKVDEIEKENNVELTTLNSSRKLNH